MRNCSRDLNKQSLFVELYCREEGCPDAMTQAVQAAEEEREIIRSRKAVKVVLLNPAALEDCDLLN